jgi:hypothetical protein
VQPSCPRWHARTNWYVAPPGNHLPACTSEMYSCWGWLPVVIFHSHCQHCCRAITHPTHIACCLQEPDPDRSTPGPGAYLKQQQLRPQSAPQAAAAGFVPAHRHPQQQLFGRGPGRECAIGGLPGVTQPPSVAPGVSCAMCPALFLEIMWRCQFAMLVSQ